jgi:hypothetical protein
VEVGHVSERPHDPGGSVGLANAGAPVLIGELNDDGVGGAITVVRTRRGLERDYLDGRDRRDAHDSRRVTIVAPPIRRAESRWQRSSS